MCVLSVVHCSIPYTELQFWLEVGDVKLGSAVDVWIKKKNQNIKLQ